VGKEVAHVYHTKVSLPLPLLKMLEQVEYIFGRTNTLAYLKRKKNGLYNFTTGDWRLE
jgi:hypothetical protein